MDQMRKIIASALVAAFAVLCAVAPSAAQLAYNGTGSTTHSNSATPYTGNQLFATNTSGSAVASPIILGGTQSGQLVVIKALIYSNGTNKPGTSTLWLYSQKPTTTSLVDGSAYVGPYAADLAANIYLGSLTCSAWQVTNDGTAQYFSECSGSNLMLSTVLPAPSQASQMTIFALEEIGAYTPIANEKHSYFLRTIINN
jgi:hypothetical protein